jgi:hypothetical protein
MDVFDASINIQIERLSGKGLGGFSSDILIRICHFLGILVPVMR